MNGGSNCEPTILTKVTSGLNQNEDHNIVTSKVGKSCVIDKNVNKTRFVYNSKVNPTCIEALMSKQTPRGRTVKCTNVIHSGDSDFHFGFVPLSDQLVPNTSALKSMSQIY